MNLFTILIIVFAALVGLVFLIIIATILTAGIFFLVPHLEQTWMALSLWVLAKHATRVTARALQRTLATPSRSFAVSVCIRPLAHPQYLVGLSGRKPVWSVNKEDAR